MATIGAQRGTYRPVHTTTTTKKNANTDPGSKSASMYTNDDRAEAFRVIHEGKVDEGNGENSSCGGKCVKDG